MAELVSINGVTTQGPTAHGWIPPEQTGIGAAGNVVISSVWSYSLSWNFMFPDEYKLIFDIWNANQGTDITARLPELGAATYIFKTYTCRINPVIFSSFFETTVQGVSTILVGIDITA